MLISVGPSVRQLRAWLESALHGFDTLDEADAIENARQELVWTLAYLEVVDNAQDACAVLPGVERRVLGEPLCRDGEIIDLAHGEGVGTILTKRVARSGLDAVNDNVSGLGFPNYVRRVSATVPLVGEGDKELFRNRTAKRLLGKDIARFWRLERLEGLSLPWRKRIHWLSGHVTTFARFWRTATVTGCRTDARAGSQQGDLR